LLLFYSDFRCPHQVLEVKADERYAVTVWFMGEERAGGPPGENTERRFPVPGGGMVGGFPGEEKERGAPVGGVAGVDPG